LIDAEIDRILKLQAHEDLSFLGVRCYLCREKGHIAKNCKQFIIIYDRSDFIRESDNVKCRYNKRMSANNKINSISSQRIRRLSLNMMKRNTGGFITESATLNKRCSDYVKETNVKNYKAKVINVKESSESLEEEPDRHFSILPIRSQYTNHFLMKRHSVSESSYRDSISSMSEWEDSADNLAVTISPNAHEAFIINPLFSHVLQPED
jgi:hypothetical protein